MNEALRSFIEDNPEDWKLLRGRIIFSLSDQQVANTFHQNRRSVRNKLNDFNDYVTRHIQGKEIGAFPVGWNFYKELNRQETLTKFKNRTLDLDSIQLKTIDGVKRISYKILGHLLTLSDESIRWRVQSCLSLDKVYIETKTIVKSKQPVANRHFYLTHEQALTIVKKQEYPEIVNAAIVELDYIFSR